MTPAFSKHKFVLTTLSLALTRLSCCAAQNPNVPPIAGCFGTKGRYEDVNPRLRDDVLAVDGSHLRPPPSGGCTPVHLTAIIRHGTRYPTVKNIRRMRRLYDLVMDEASNSEDWLGEIKSHWEMWYTDNMDGKLVEKGRDDHRHLAVRLAMLFPSLLCVENLRRHRIHFLTSSKERCLDSLEAFQQGLHKHWAVKGVSYQYDVNNELMRFFDHCRSFIEGVENNKTALIEVEKFKRGQEMERVQRKVAKKLNIPHKRITPDLVEAAFFLCSYEFSIRSLNSPWCHLFDEDDAKVLEYKSDLKQYWKRGHGHSINSKSSCSLFHDLFARLELAVQQSRLGQEIPEAATIQVGHAETLLPLLSLLGFYKDQTPPTSENYSKQHGRSFQTSKVVPYAANMLFVLYDCHPEPRLQFLLNESPVQFPGMEEDAPLYQDVRQRYRHLLEGCDFKKECEVKPRERHSHDRNSEL
ncbi:multiple inositol polyphosphate phosphatase 1b [Lampris incognitus]|uniref:multiple inositol polyphosphate phosphatase 1b n=1 Tax=Lampris incognitus TaxID=2546036 RepID=UPI0024B62ED2|nr:multiple inositol polyphosphate phosphatase 1b [Lampris incognitus]